MKSYYKNEKDNHHNAELIKHLKKEINKRVGIGPFLSVVRFIKNKIKRALALSKHLFALFIIKLKEVLRRVIGTEAYLKLKETYYTNMKNK